MQRAGVVTQVVLKSSIKITLIGRSSTGRLAPRSIMHKWLRQFHPRKAACNVQAEMAERNHGVQEVHAPKVLAQNHENTTVPIEAFIGAYRSCSTGRKTQMQIVKKRRRRFRTNDDQRDASMMIP
jgi:hypothetical protein